MLTRDRIIQLLQSERGYLANEFGVSRIALFGSYVTDRSVEDSDIDLFVELDRPLGFRFLELVDHLEQLLGKKVDVLTKAGIENIRVGGVAKSISESLVYV